MTTQTERMYELVLVLSPEIADDEIPAALELIHQAIADRGGSIQDQENWGRRKLAYPIQKQLEGSYILSKLNLDPQRIKDVDTNLKLQEAILRHMILRVEE